MDLPELNANAGTLLRKRKVTIDKTETLMILRSYLATPTNWADIIESIKGNADQLSEQARQLYTTGTNKQLRERASGKLRALMKLHTIEDHDIRDTVQAIKNMERRLVTRSENQPQTSSDMPDRRDTIAAQMSSSEDEAPDSQGGLEQDASPAPARRRGGKKRPLSEIVRDNQERYNRFIRKKMPKILRELGISSDSSDTN